MLMFTNKKRCHIFVEFFKEHKKVTPYRFLSHILQNKKICHIASCCIFIKESVDIVAYYI